MESNIMKTAADFINA